MEINTIARIIKNRTADAVGLLKELIRIPSVRGQEKDISRFLKSKIEPFADSAELVEMPESIVADPDYSFRIENFMYNGAANLRVKLNGVGQSRSVAINTHLDVVPASAGQDNAFDPVESDGKIYGRGANDCKGQIATLWLVLASLAELGLRPRGDVTIDFVLEEECGGNGSLLVVRNGLKADAAIVMEPTELQVIHLIRGAVWFTVETRGKAGHSGSPGTTVSALKEAINAMDAIEGVREKLLQASRKHVAKIAEHPNPMPLTFGMLHSGNWPAAAPGHAELKGVFGFLPPFNRTEVQKELSAAVNSDNATIHFDMLNNDPSFTEENHPLVQTMLQSAQRAGFVSKPEFMNASCDAWRYSEQLKIPTVVFGAGSLSTAHSKEEHIAIAAIQKAALALILFLDSWSGFK
ncbi:MAG: M20 family metallopeptidase [Candidatus Zhuqueibacterota bacterium]